MHSVLVYSSLLFHIVYVHSLYAATSVIVLIEGKKVVQKIIIRYRVGGFSTWRETNVSVFTENVVSLQIIL